MSLNGINVAVFQGQPVRGDVEANVCILEAVLKDCKIKGIDVVLFPELFLSGYDLSIEEFHTIAFNYEDDFVYICDLAKENNCAIAVGYPELVDNTVLYNSCILIDSSGQKILNYRKTHLWDPELVHEKVVFEVGDSLPVVDLTIARLGISISVGILICFDCEFPEPARVLALQGMKLLLIPTALADAADLFDTPSISSTTTSTVTMPSKHGDATPTVMVPSRAMENHVFVLYANLVGPCMLDVDATPTKPNPRFCGQSAIIAPNGRDLNRASNVGTGLLTAIINYSEYESAIQRNNYLSNRRVELYRRMLEGVGGLDTATTQDISTAPTTSTTSTTTTLHSNISVVHDVSKGAAAAMPPTAESGAEDGSNSTCIMT